MWTKCCGHALFNKSILIIDFQTYQTAWWQNIKHYRSVIHKKSIKATSFLPNHSKAATVTLSSIATSYMYYYLSDRKKSYHFNIHTCICISNSLVYHFHAQTFFSMLTLVPLFVKIKKSFLLYWIKNKNGILNEFRSFLNALVIFELGKLHFFILT